MVLRGGGDVSSLSLFSNGAAVSDPWPSLNVTVFSVYLWDYKRDWARKLLWEVYCRCENFILQFFQIIGVRGAFHYFCKNNPPEIIWTVSNFYGSEIRKFWKLYLYFSKLGCFWVYFDPLKSYLTAPCFIIHWTLLITHPTKFIRKSQLLIVFQKDVLEKFDLSQSSSVSQITVIHTCVRGGSPLPEDNAFLCHQWNVCCE